MSDQVRALLLNTGSMFTPLASTAAYSLRLLNATYTGPVVQVRRSSDNALNTFTANQVTDGTLVAWVGAGNDGFVRTWYDQARNLYHAIQQSAGNQPQIVSNGSINLQNSKPTIVYNALSWLEVSNLGTIAQPFFIFAACKRNLLEADTVFDLLNASGGQNTFYIDSSSGFTWKYTSQSGIILQGLSSLNNTNLNLFTVIGNGASSAIYGNTSASMAGNAGLGSLVNLIIGSPRLGIALSEAFYQNYRLNGSIPEFILYNSDQTANRSAIEAEINSYYNIF